MTKIGFCQIILFDNYFSPFSRRFSRKCTRNVWNIVNKKWVLLFETPKRGNIWIYEYLGKKKQRKTCLIYVRTENKNPMVYYELDTSVWLGTTGKCENGKRKIWCEHRTIVYDQNGILSHLETGQKRGEDRIIQSWTRINLSSNPYII